MADSRRDKPGFEPSQSALVVAITLARRLVSAAASGIGDEQAPLAQR
jgi:hypothetical protein